MSFYRLPIIERLSRPGISSAIHRDPLQIAQGDLRASFWPLKILGRYLHLSQFE